MLEVTIRRISKTTPEDMIASVDAHINRLRTALPKLAQEVADHMKSIIADNALHKPTSGNLEVNIKAEKMDMYAYGVGNIAWLDQRAPYWALINFGGNLPPNHNATNFVPGQWFGDKFHYSPNCGEGFRVNTDIIIEGMFYVEQTAAWLSRYWAEFWRKWAESHSGKGSHGWGPASAGAR